MIQTYTLDAAGRSMGNPLVSILIPAYNAEKWITAAIRSALAQTWNPKEIIVVDDGSNDRTVEFASQFGQELVQIVSQEHQGASAARNNAFNHCHGDYIQWLDADDLLAPEKIAKQMEAVCECGNNRTLFSSPWGQFYYRPERAKLTPSALWLDLSSPEFLMRKMGQNLFMQTSTWLVSRQLTEAAGPWSTSLSADDDGEYFCRVLMASDGVRFVPDAKVYYRYSGRKGLNYIGRSDKKMDSLWRSMQLHIGYLRCLEDSERTRAACVKYLQTNLVYFYSARPDIVEQAQQKAKELGQRLDPPRISWKFSWLRVLVGWDVAIGAQHFMPHLKWWLVSFWDKILFRIESRDASSAKANPVVRPRNSDSDESQATAAENFPAKK
ncbi:MAG: glycosyltransferase family 2 protein [Terriglobales bacterium]|jgi:glycosyltransferase involved in cell wall biosynthesis